jgi:hypothetical protein
MAGPEGVRAVQGSRLEWRIGHRRAETSRTAAFLDALAKRASGPPRAVDVTALHTRSTPTILSPACGPFDADDALLFFGREEQTVELLRRLDDTRFLSIVGLSGAASRRWCAPGCCRPAPRT